MSLDNEPEIVEAREYISRAQGGLSTLHLGPLDYNTMTTTDDLRAAIRLIEQFAQLQASRAKAEGR